MVKSDDSISPHRFWEVMKLKFGFLTICIFALFTCFAEADIICEIKDDWISNFSLEVPQEIRALEDLNSEIARLNRFTDGIDRFIPDEEVFKINYSDDRAKDHSQPVPLRVRLFPQAYTGIYQHRNPEMVVSERHQALFIFLPGTGARSSIAKSLFDIALTFQKTKRNLALQVNDVNIRAASFPMDLPLNGLAEHAPFFMSSSRGNIAVLRHIVLYLKIKYPGKPIFIGGRSQGGLVALEYARYYSDVAGVMAMNPSHSDQRVIDFSINTSVNDRGTLYKDEVKSPMTLLHFPSWAAYKAFTNKYTAHQNPSQVPVLLLLSRADPSYPQPLYLDLYRSFQAEQPDMRQVVEFPVDKHNLWARKDEELYPQVIQEMAGFIHRVLFGSKGP